MNHRPEHQSTNTRSSQYSNATIGYYSIPNQNSGQSLYLTHSQAPVTYLVQAPNFLMQQPLQLQQHISTLQQQLALKDLELALARQEIEKRDVALHAHRAEKMNLRQGCEFLKKENETLIHQNIDLKRQMLGTQPVSYDEDANQLSFLSSSISATQNRPGAFEYQVLTLPSQSSPDLTLSLELPVLRFRLEDEYNSSEYVQQFVPYILEETRAGLAGQMEQIKMHQLRPFTASFDPEKRATAGEFAWNLICRTEEFPKLAHEFQNEAVFIVIKKSRSNTNTAQKWETTEPLEGFLAIASSLPGRQDHLDSHKKPECVFSLMLLKDQYEKNADYWQNKGNILEIHWLHGLIPAAREYEACINPNKFFLESQISRGNLPGWPEIEHTSPLNQTSPYASQNEVIKSLESVQSGLYVLQGPPGTGKTTTIVALLSKWVSKYPNERILLCAPSNSAVLEVFARAKRNLPDVCMVVLGNTKNPSEIKSEDFVKYYALNLYRTLQELLALPNTNLEELKAKLLLEYVRILNKLYEFNHHERMSFVKTTVRNKLKNLETYFSGSIRALNDENTFLESEDVQAHIQASIDILKENAHFLEYYLVQRAQIVFSTLTGSGRDFLKKQIHHFQRVVIDESSQAVIPTTLIPLVRFNPNVCILVGDPKQLPATISSKNAQKNGYGTSLMSCFIEQNQEYQSTYPYKMLTTQFRMHQEICLWPSQRYYGGALETDASVFGRSTLFSKSNSIFSIPTLFFNIQGKENSQGHSFINQKEAEAIVATTIYLLNCGLQAGQIGIITFYAAQVSRILQELKSQLKKIPPGLTVSTVDGFQGSEKEFIIISAVRTKPNAGFLADSHRVNVALTRAMHNVFLFGHADAIRQSNSDLAAYTEQTTVVPEKDLYAAINRSWG